MPFDGITIHALQEEIGDYLKILFADTPEFGSSIPIYFYATGGMRL